MGNWISLVKSDGVEEAWGTNQSLIA